jgi:hypothetical protein
MQVNLLGFMDKYGAAHFTETLWNLLISAQNTVGGVPAEVSLLIASRLNADMVVHRGKEEGDSNATGSRAGTCSRTKQSSTSTTRTGPTKGALSCNSYH